MPIEFVSLKSCRALLLAGSALLSATWSLGTAQAQEAPQVGEAETAPGDIVVTARRRAESAQDVPV